MTDLVLTGFMGTGKTTVGRILADRYGLELVDTDDVIERRAGKTVPEIFAHDGEAHFRRLESDVLSDLIANRTRIVATGGGALVSEQNRALLDGTRVICLTCDAEELTHRLNGTGHRPLLSGGRDFRELLAARTPVYASFEQVDTTARAAEDVAAEIGTRLGLNRLPPLEFERSATCDIVVERGAALRLAGFLGNLDIAGDMLIVTDVTVADLGIARVVERSLIDGGFRVNTCVLPPGEETKSLSSLDRLFREAIGTGLDRQATVVGVGGGVICDLAGMLAATYMRGVRLVLMPTTLLAQADAAIGGKVGIDVAGVKNLAGAFHPARVVVIDPDILRTLPEERVAEGLAEIIKIGVIRNAALFGAVEAFEQASAALDRADVLRTAIAEKARLVAEDPYEQGPRALLNFGHTVGHGVEAASGYGLAHGAAIGIGMVAEARLAEATGRCDAGLAQRLTATLARLGLPIEAPGLDADSVYAFLVKDKKRQGVEHRFSLPVRPGVGAVFRVTDAEARAAIGYAVGRAT